MPARGDRPLVLHTEASRGFGGQEIRILTECRWLLRHGWSALVAAQPGSPLLEEATAAGIPAVPVRMRHPADPLALLALRRLMRARGASIVHTHSSVDSWVAGVAARSLGLPLVRSRHVTIPVSRRRAAVYHLADRVITSGEAVRQILIDAGVPGSRIVSIPPGVDTERFHPHVSGDAVRAELGLTGRLVGIVADMRASKGHRYFLEAARAIVVDLPDVRFLVVGDGVGRDHVQGLVRDLGLEGTVVMTGFRRDIPEVMAALDVLVLPSIKSEATPQVVLQALAVGTPVVATDVGGIPEVVRDGETGRLVPPADSAALARAIVDMLDDPVAARKMAAAGQALVRERCTLDASLRATTAVYAELLERR